MRISDDIFIIVVGIDDQIAHGSCLFYEKHHFKLVLLLKLLRLPSASKQVPRGIYNSPFSNRYSSYALPTYDLFGFGQESSRIKFYFKQ